MRGKSLTVITAGLVSALTLSSCGGASADDGDVVLRFTWWGSDQRQQITQEIIDEFEAQNPGITVEGEYRDGGGYHDQLNVQMAGGDAPDIFQVEDPYLRDYADRGALLELTEFDTSGMEEATADLGLTEEGRFGATVSIVSNALVANPALFEEAGVDLPDDTTWTWDDFAEISAELRANLGDGQYGAATMGANEATVRLWLRQRGKDLFGDDGELLMTVEDAEEFLQFVMDMEEKAEFPSASYIDELSSRGLADGPMGSREAAMVGEWATLMLPLTEATGDELQLLRFPSDTGHVDDNGEWIKAGMFFAVSSGTEHPEEAQQFINFFINSEEAAEISRMDRGIPANTNAREIALVDATAAETEAFEYVQSVEKAGKDTIPLPPPGGNQVAEIVTRYLSEVRFGNSTIENAAQTMVNEIEAALG
ncbi:ABC transporter substrate-binding protein [Nesterenkonia rhizosphaerae]|uniref:Extracellular solute-binding protein n=1 Tax=Nesterenkonia rhizosphaerae TaxID=1348272 RepID=A0ABP9FTQ1_9MICC